MARAEVLDERDNHLPSSLEYKVLSCFAVPQTTLVVGSVNEQQRQLNFKNQTDRRLYQDRVEIEFSRLLNQLMPKELAKAREIFELGWRKMGWR